MSRKRARARKPPRHLGEAEVGPLTFLVLDALWTLPEKERYAYVITTYVSVRLGSEIDRAQVSAALTTIRNRGLATHVECMSPRSRRVVKMHSLSAEGERALKNSVQLYCALGKTAAVLSRAMAAAA